MKNILLLLVLLYGIFKTQNTVCNDHSKDVHFTVAINLKFSDNSSNALHNEDFDSAYIDQVILKLPKTYSENGKPTRLVYCAHGAGGGVTADSWFLENYSIVDSLLANGYAVFDVNGGSNLENMGGSAVVQSAYKAY
jgi:hypothetical protein